MQITLKNFRCYTDSRFDFGDGGLVLVSGPSGQGKSSILAGIYFALYGTGTKVTAYGKTSCSVELEFDGMKVVRTKRPNRLVVNDVYEDEVAQELINKKFGDTFNVTGYVAQNALNSFIVMSPIDKLAFLEKFVFRDVDLGQIKGRCKAHITKQHDELLGVVSQLDMAKHVLDELKIPNEVKFPIKCKQSQRDIVIKNESIRLKKSRKLLSTTEETLQIMLDELNDLKVLDATLRSRSETYTDTQTSLESIKEQISNNLYEGDELLLQKERILHKIIAEREVIALKAQFDTLSAQLSEMSINESEDIRKEIEVIKDKLWKEYSKDEIKVTISDMKQCVSDLEQIESLNKDLAECNVDKDEYQRHIKEKEQISIKLEDNYRLQDKIKMQKEVYSCPSCTAKLKIDNSKLIVFSDYVDSCSEDSLQKILQDIKMLKQESQRLQTIISDQKFKISRADSIVTQIDTLKSSYDELPDLDDVKGDLEYLREYQSSNMSDEKKLRILEKSLEEENFSQSYVTFKSNVDKLQKKLLDLQKDVVNEESVVYDYTEEELRNIILTQKSYKSNYDDLLRRKSILDDELCKSKKILDSCKNVFVKKYGEIRSVEILTKLVEDEQEKIISLKNDVDTHEGNIKKIEGWKLYQEELQKYQEWEEKVESLTEKEKLVRNEYAAGMKLKEKILEAESIAITNIIESINTHARVYLDSFFSENPISVQLQPFKETKKATKPVINIEIEYKGMEADISMLSGGELSRVILAYTLALAEMFNSPLLLLDECTASLDQDMASTVFEVIRENFNGKLVIIIAHQVVTGTFDKSICLSSSSDIVS